MARKIWHDLKEFEEDISSVIAALILAGLFVVSLIVYVAVVELRSILN